MILSKSKLTAHCLINTGEALDFVKAGARTIKLLDGAFGMAADIQRLSPNCLIIGRAYRGYDPVDRDQGIDPKVSAAQWVSAQLATYQRNPAIKFWEGPNESLCDTLEKMRWYSEFEIERMKLLEAVGLKAVIGNFSVGQPRLDIPVWKEFLPALRRAQENGHLLGLHEYGGVFMWWMTGGYQRNPAENIGQYGWTTLRYRQVVDQYLKPAGLNVNIVITETGLDAVSPQPANFRTGNWKDCAAQWDSTNTLNQAIPFRDDGERYYADQLIWYDRELQKDGYVLGATIFTVGNNAGWGGYDIAGTRVSRYLIDYLVANPSDTVPNPEPTPVPEPVPEPGRNLLLNGDLFSDGYYLAPGTDNRRIPKRWNLTWQEKIVRIAELSTHENQKEWLPPEAAFRSNDGRPNTEILPAFEQPLYLDVLNGILVVYHIFKGWGKQWWSLGQTLENVQTGKYRWQVHFYPDIYFRHETKKLFPHRNGDEQTGQWRLNVSGQPGLDWQNGGTMPLADTPANRELYADHGGIEGRRFYGHWKTLTREFNHNGGDLTVDFEFRCLYGVDVVGVFIRDVSLVRVGNLDGTPIPEPTPEPLPIHDSLLLGITVKDGTGDEVITNIKNDLNTIEVYRFTSERLK
jgi:hypothetical protein